MRGVSNPIATVVDVQVNIFLSSNLQPERPEQKKRQRPFPAQRSSFRGILVIFEKTNDQRCHH
jgi:hypothetical protein